MSRVEFLEGIVRINDMEESKRSEALSGLVDSFGQDQAGCEGSTEGARFQAHPRRKLFAWRRSIRPGTGSYISQVLF